MPEQRVIDVEVLEIDELELVAGCETTRLELLGGVIGRNRLRLIVDVKRFRGLRCPFSH
jgi:hypothetical protein